MNGDGISMSSKVTVQIGLIVVLCAALASGVSWKKSLEYRVSAVEQDLCLIKGRNWNSQHMVLWVEKSKNRKTLVNPMEIVK